MICAKKKRMESVRESNIGLVALDESSVRLSRFFNCDCEILESDLYKRKTSVHGNIKLKGDVKRFTAEIIS